MSLRRSFPRLRPRRLLPPLICVAAGLGVTLSPIGAGAQEGCEFGDKGKNDVFRSTLPGVGVITYISGPHFICEGGVQIWADSAVAYEARGMSHFMGAVRYVEGGRELLSDEARYFSNLGRLQAQGHVSIRDESQGSLIENGDLVFLRETEERAEETMTVTTGADGIRPRAVLPPPASDGSDPSAPPGKPYEIVGDVIVLHGASAFTSVGNVEIVRDSLLAFADSVEYDPELGYLLLEGSARIESSSYDLRGRTITMSTPGAETSEVHAIRDARLTGNDLELTAAQIYVFLRNDEIERLVAIPITRDDGLPADSTDAARPEAKVQDFVLTADSLEIRAPNQAIEQVFAAGSARSVSDSRDSLSVAILPEIAQSDWLEGDTIIVTFKPPVPEDAEMAPSPDSTGFVQVRHQRGGDLEVESIVALVNARSLYRLAPSDTTSRPGIDPPAVHYVVGDQITIEMAFGQVAALHVVGQTRGVHMEPLLRIVPADTTVLSDTLAVLDTAAVIDTTLIVEGRPPATKHLPSGSPRGRSPETPNVPDQPRTPDAPREEKPWIRL